MLKGKGGGPVPKGNKGSSGVDLHIDLGGFSTMLGGLLDLVSRVVQEGEEIRKEGEITGLGEKVRGVYGFSVRIMGGAPSLETFGNIKRTQKGAVIEEVREPLIDLFEEEEKTTVIAEIPGIDQADIVIDLQGETLIISAGQGERKYRKEVQFSRKVRQTSMQRKYRNGILEIVFENEG